jgi:hypothetical protein
VDGVEAARSTANIVTLQRVLPGLRKITALAKARDGNALEPSKAIEVKAGVLNLTFPGYTVTMRNRLGNSSRVAVTHLITEEALRARSENHSGTPAASCSARSL